MAEAVTRTQDAFDVINGIRGQVQQRKSELMATWGGNAANAFDRTVNQWDEKCMKVLNALNDLKEGLGQARTTYEVTEEQQESGVSQVEQLLNEA